MQSLVRGVVWVSLLRFHTAAQFSGPRSSGLTDFWTDPNPSVMDLKR